MKTTQDPVQQPDLNEEELLAEDQELDEMVEESVQPQGEQSEQLAEMAEQLQMARENERRAFADYKNLLRRTQEERGKMVKMAAANVIESILQPLDHLSLAAAQLKDPGLNMVYGQFQQALANEGLEEIDCLGKPFDSLTMEVIDTQPANKGQKVGTVIKIAQKGYTLNGEVIQHAKVVVTEEKNN